MDMKELAVVTGAAGFIGSHMVDLLLKMNFRVHAIDDLSRGREQNLSQHRNDPNLIFEVIDLKAMPEDHGAFKGVSYVFHFAGLGDIVPSIERPVSYLSANVMGTVSTLEAARRAGARKFVYAASSSCYGLAKQLPTTELAALNPEYPYALSKLMGEQAVFHWGQVYKLPVISLRMFNVYGPRSRTTGAYGAVFGVFLAQKLAGKPFTVVGNGSQTRDFVFVTDVARAFLAAAQTEKEQEVYNVGAGHPQSVNRLVELLGGGEVVHLPKRPGEPDCTWADISKIGKDLLWSPTVPFEEGVLTMLGCIDHWRDAPLWDEQAIEEVTAKWFKALS